MLFCMRTTLNLDDRLMKAVKQRAVAEGTTMTRIVERALRETLERSRQPPEPFELQWVAVGEGGIQPGVDLNDRDSLYERMEDRT